MSRTDRSKVLILKGFSPLEMLLFSMQKNNNMYLIIILKYSSR